VTLRYIGPTDMKSHLIAKVRTDGSGRFSHRGWKPREPGQYEVFASVARISPKLDGGVSCPRAFELRR
jgi:hypothetical protein